MWLNHLTVMLRPVWGLYWRFDVHGAVDEVPSAGPLLVVANHASFLDPWFLSILFPRRLRHLINQGWYERSLFWKTFFDANGTVPTSDKNPDETMEAVRAALERGRTVCVFPEGRISKDGRVRRFRSGIAWMAARTGAPVIPVGIRGAYESIPRHQRWPKRGKVELHIGRPRRFPEVPEGEEPSMRDLFEFRDVLHADVVRLAGQAPPAGVVPHPKSHRRGEEPGDSGEREKNVKTGRWPA